MLTALGVVLAVILFGPILFAIAAMAGDGARALAGINAQRARLVLAPLRGAALLTRAAQAHADDMAANGFLSHQGSDGADLARRLDRVGYRYHRAAENVAWGHKTAASVVAGWMASADHRRNILMEEASGAGIAHAAGKGGGQGGGRAGAKAGRVWVLIIAQPFKR